MCLASWLPHRQYTIFPRAYKNNIIASQHKKYSYYQTMRTQYTLAWRLMSNRLVRASWNLSPNRNCWLKILGCQYNTKKKTMSVHFASWSFIIVKRDPFCLRKPVISRRSINFTILCSAGDSTITSVGGSSEERSMLTLYVLEQSRKWVLIVMSVKTTCLQIE